jgi:hypothetical protein
VTPTPPPARESDDVMAPAAFAWIGLVVAALVAFLYWVFWLRGNP